MSAIESPHVVLRKAYFIGLILLHMCRYAVSAGLLLTPLHILPDRHEDWLRDRRMRVVADLSSYSHLCSRRRAVLLSAHMPGIK